MPKNEIHAKLGRIWRAQATVIVVAIFQGLGFQPLVGGVELTAMLGSFATGPGRTKDTLGDDFRPVRSALSLRKGR